MEGRVLPVTWFFPPQAFNMSKRFLSKVNALLSLAQSGCQVFFIWPIRFIDKGQPPRGRKSLASHSAWAHHSSLIHD
jgi:hypothetical protein